MDKRIPITWREKTPRSSYQTLAWYKSDRMVWVSNFIHYRTIFFEQGTLSLLITLKNIMRCYRITYFMHSAYKKSYLFTTEPHLISQSQFNCCWGRYLQTLVWLSHVFFNRINSTNLTPCDFWLYLRLKDKIFREHLTTAFILKKSTLRHIRNIHADFLCPLENSVVFRIVSIVERVDLHTEQVLLLWFACLILSFIEEFFLNKLQVQCCKSIFFVLRSFV